LPFFGTLPGNGAGASFVLFRRSTIQTGFVNAQGRRYALVIGNSNYGDGIWGNY
jgi:hypothetical protein